LPVNINLINQPRALGATTIAIFINNGFVLVPSEKKIRYARNPENRNPNQ
jgi:hypothetical protein|tara:strand:+ start:57 stop:206 length:150 start_codon:yes stop_codon:yes gene_type:complete